VTGRFLADRDTLVQAVTERGGGFWVLTPFRTTGGWTVLVNRGFVPPGWRGADAGAAGEVTGEAVVTGLLRMTEPKGGFLRSNDPGRDRWYSRDTAAIAAARHLSNVAPYFIDADAGPDPNALPHGGMTVIRFPNNHLVYALTWFGLALMLSGATIVAARDEWLVRRRPQGSGKGARRPR
jgi:surfeit locus 1 family protein